jgi:hypothetical protein
MSADTVMRYTLDGATSVRERFVGEAHMDPTRRSAGSPPSSGFQFSVLTEESARGRFGADVSVRPALSSSAKITRAMAGDAVIRAQFAADELVSGRIRGATGVQ